MKARRTAGPGLLLPLLALVSGASFLPAQAPAPTGGRDTAARPAVHVLTTGGTIASRPGENLAGRELVAGVPGIREVARLSVEQFSDIGSSKMTPVHWLKLAGRIREVFRERSDLAGIVVTHGTDTMEETAYFLHLTVPDPRPVLMTGAMRPPGAPGADAGRLHGRFADALSWDRLPRVRIAYSYPGADATSVRRLAGDGAIGLVVASMGRGNLSAAQEEAVRTVVDRGVPVMLSSRTMAGPVPVGDPGDGVIGAGGLNPQKARVLFALALTETEDPAELAEVFARTR